jgi:hypothetical protein
LLAPGCDLEEANPVSGAPLEEYAGTSQATAIAAAVLAALRAYRPDLEPVQAEQLLTSTAQAAGGSLDVTALFQAAGLSGVIEAGERNKPVAPSSTLSGAPEIGGPVTVPRLPRPRLTVRHRGHTVLVHMLNLPADGKALLSVFARDHNHHRVQLARIATRHPTVRLQAHAHAVLDVSYTPLRADGAATSPMKAVAL